MTDHQHEDEEEVTLSVAAQALADPNAKQSVELSADRPGLHLELTDLRTDPPADDEWELDPDADMGLKVLVAGLDPEIASQLLRVAAEFLEQATIEE